MDTEPSAWEHLKGRHSQRFDEILSLIEKQPPTKEQRKFLADFSRDLARRAKAAGIALPEEIT